MKKRIWICSMVTVAITLAIVLFSFSTVGREQTPLWLVAQKLLSEKHEGTETKHFVNLYSKCIDEWYVVARKYPPRTETTDGIVDSPIGTTLLLSEDLTITLNGNELFLPYKLAKVSGCEIGRQYNLITSYADEIGSAFIVDYQNALNGHSASFGIILCEDGNIYFAAGGTYMDRGLYMIVRQGDG